LAAVTSGRLDDPTPPLTASRVLAKKLVDDLMQTQSTTVRNTPSAGGKGDAAGCLLIEAKKIADVVGTSQWGGLNMLGQKTLTDAFAAVHRMFNSKDLSGLRKLVDAAHTALKAVVAATVCKAGGTKPEQCGVSFKGDLNIVLSAVGFGYDSQMVEAAKPTAGSPHNARIFSRPPVHTSPRAVAAPQSETKHFGGAIDVVLQRWQFLSTSTSASVDFTAVIDEWLAGFSLESPDLVAAMRHVHDQYKSHYPRNISQFLEGCCGILVKTLAHSTVKKSIEALAVALAAQVVAGLDKAEVAGISKQNTAILVGYGVPQLQAVATALGIAPKGLRRGLKKQQDDAAKCIWLTTQIDNKVLLEPGRLLQLRDQLTRRTPASSSTTAPLLPFSMQTTSF